ncbi:MAG: hypothetical protein KAX20_05755, partial [Candidatus Omnitrophica bacterium]|nr:hypothetical protein [Candidatus Omnitrophota bacterium]
MTKKRKVLFSIALLLIVLGIILPQYLSKSRRAERCFRKGFTHFSLYRGKAVPYLRKAVALQPQNSKYHEGLAWAINNEIEISDILKKKSDVDIQEVQKEAIIEYKRAISLDPSNPRLRYYLSQLYQGEEAIKEIEKALELNPKNSLLNYELAYLFSKEERNKEVINQVREGNEKENIYLYFPIFLPRNIEDYSIGEISIFTSAELPLLSHYREVARNCVEMAKNYQKRDEINKAISLYNETVRMGRVVMATKPRTLIRFLVGMAIQEIAYRPLKELYQEKGMLREVAEIEKRRKRLKSIQKECKKYASGTMFPLIKRVTRVMAPISTLFCVFILQLILIFFLWIQLRIFRRLKRKKGAEEVKVFLPQKNWRRLIKLYSLIYLPLYCLTTGISLWYIRYYSGAHPAFWIPQIVTLYLPLLSAIIMACLLLIFASQSLFYNYKKQVKDSSFWNFLFSRHIFPGIRILESKGQILLLSKGLIFLIALFLLVS